MRPKRTILHDLRDDSRLAARFWAKVPTVLEGHCRPFLGYCNRFGYGKFGVDGRVHFAHRIAWELTHGPIPGDMRVLHRCDNPSCCNPDHLFLGTLSDNMKDMWNKGRHVKPVNKSGRDWSTRFKGTGQLKGEAHLSAKLTRNDVLMIREQHAAGTGPTVLGERFGVTKQAIRAITLRKTWKHV